MTKNSENEKSAGTSFNKRNQFGLYDHVNYKYDDQGFIDWRAMIEPQYLYPNSDWFIQREKEVPITIDGLSDEQLLIKLMGVRRLARLRGISNVEMSLVYKTESSVCVKCKIDLIPNYETDMGKLSYEEIASVTPENTSNKMAWDFAETIACNRAFVRAVRNALDIPILGGDEIGGRADFKKKIVTESSSTNPSNILKEKVESKFKVKDFESFKLILHKSTYKNKDLIDQWSSYEDVPPQEIMSIVGLMNAKN